MLFVRILRLFIFCTTFFRRAFSFKFNRSGEFQFILLKFSRVIRLFISLGSYIMNAIVAGNFFRRDVRKIALNSNE